MSGIYKQIKSLVFYIAVLVETCNFHEDSEARELDALDKMAERTGDLNDGNRSEDLNEEVEPIDYSVRGKRTQGNLVMKINV